MARQQTYTAAGKRKTAVARVFLKPGKGEITVNRRSFDNYFKTPNCRKVVDAPFEQTETTAKFDTVVNVRGGGVKAQLEATRHGIAKALLEYDGELRSILKKAQLLTRDARKKERKKYGQKGARARFQFSKR